MAAAADLPYVKATLGFDRRPYELEVMFHMAGLCDLLRAVGYPYLEHRRPGLKLDETLCTGAFDAGRVEAVKAWVTKWVVSPVRERMDDVRAFMNNDAEQAWFHSWLHTRQGWSIQYRNWGALSLCCLMGVEPSIVDWVSRLYSHFFRHSNTGTLDGRPRLSFDAYQFCPKLHHTRKPSVAVYRINERLTYNPQARHYGTLEPGRAHETTHLEFMVNLDSEPQLSESGDICLTYSEDSHTLDYETRVRRLVEGMKDGTRHTTRKGKVSYTKNEITEEAILKVMRLEVLRSHYSTLGFDLTPELGVTLTVHGGRRMLDHTTCPLWVGPAKKVDLNPGEIIAWPANLVHGFPNFHGKPRAIHLSKRLNFSTSFQVLANGCHPHLTAWQHAWAMENTRKRRHQREVQHSMPPEITTRFHPSFFRSISDTTQHADDGYSYKTSVKAMNYSLHHVPEVKAFFSVPVQLARALTFRFPEQFMDVDTLNLAAELAERKSEWSCPPCELATHMVRELWAMFD
jgi:hypothetical protein